MRTNAVRLVPQGNHLASAVGATAETVAAARQDLRQSVWFGSGSQQGIAPLSELRCVGTSCETVAETDLTLFNHITHFAVFQKVTPTRDCDLAAIEFALVWPALTPLAAALRWLQVTVYTDNAGLPDVVLGRSIPVPLSIVNYEDFTLLLLPLRVPVAVTAATPIWFGFSTKAYSPDETQFYLAWPERPVNARGDRTSTPGTDDLIRSDDRYEPPLNTFVVYDDRRVWIRLYEDPTKVQLWTPGYVGPPTSPVGQRAMLARPADGASASAYNAGVRPGFGTAPWSAATGYYYSGRSLGGAVPPHNATSGKQGGSDPLAEFFHSTEDEWLGTWGHALRATSAVEAALQGTYSDAATNAVATAAWVRHLSSADMIAGFGVALDWYLRDSAGVDNLVARTAAVRGAADNIADMVWYLANGGAVAEKLRLTAAGHLGLTATGRLYLDGTACSGDTYLYESGANLLSAVVGGTERLRLASHVGIPALTRLYWDGVAQGGNTYTHESAADTLVDVVGGASILTRIATGVTDAGWLNVGAGAYAATAGYIGAERIGLGAAPLYRAHIHLPVASTDTPLHVGDGTYGVLVGGATGVANRLSPMMLFYPKDASDGGAMAMLIGQVDAASDTGTNPVIRFDARRVGALLTTRPAFGFWNYSSELARALPAGQWQFRDGSAAVPSLSFLDDTNTGIYRAGADLVGFAAGGVGQWLLSSTALYPVADNAETIGTSTLGVQALYLSDENTTAPSAEGEIRDFGTRNVLQVFGGAAVQTLTSQLYALPAAVAETGNGAALTKNWCTYTLPYALRKAGNTFRVRAHGTAYLNAAVGEGRAIVVSLNLETAAGAVIATLAQQQDNVVAGGTNHYIGWHLEGSFTCESATVINNGGYGLVTYKTASPWPGRDAANANLWEQNASVTGLGATTNYVLALDVVVVSSGADAYCRVAEFEIHMN